MSTTPDLRRGSKRGGPKPLALADGTWYSHAVASPDPSSNPLRPLPTVDMALLPEHVRARRVRRIIAVVVLLLAVAAAVIAWTQPNLGSVGEWFEERLAAAASDDREAIALPEVVPVSTVASVVAPAPESAAEPVAVERGPIERPLRRVASEPNAQFETVFGKAPSFRQALLNAGLEPDECADVERALRHIVDFRRCRPEHRIVIERDEEAALKRFEYHPTATEFVELKRNPEGVLRAEKIRVTVERKIVAKAGSVQTSIGDGLEVAGLPGGLSTYFVEAFEGRVNFAQQARKGDVFRIVADEERLDGRLLRYGRVQALEYNGQRTGRIRAFYFDVANGDGRFYDETGRAMQGGWLRVPVRYDRISSRFNPKRFHPILKRRVPHLGVDYAASTGTPVWAAARGVVAFAGRKGPNGIMVTLRHGGGVHTSYSHLHRIRRGLKRGARVKQRELIGVVGNTGRSTGPHLHFALKKGQRFVDPLAELNGPGRRMASRHMKAFKDHVTEMAARLEAISDVPPLIPGADVPVEPPVDEIMD